MADYWKSNPRKFCEACKCWFGDNKVSVEFHQGGRRHQANVQKKLSEARVRSAEDAKEKQNIAKTIHAIEHAALSAYQHDLAGGRVKRAKMPVTPVLDQSQDLKAFLAMEQEKEEREEEKKKIEEHAQKKLQEIQTKAIETAYQAYSNSYISAHQTTPWRQCRSPEGYVYYYNAVTGVTQWEPPVFPQAVMPPPPPPPPSRAPITSSAGATTMSDSLGTAEHSLKRPPPDQAELGEGGTVQHPARRKGPYGEWNTIAVIEKDEDDDTLDDQGSKKEGQEQEVEGGGADGGIQFEEKKISGDLADVDDEEVKEGFKGFAFKKRTTTKERPQTRQRTSDV